MTHSRRNFLLGASAAALFAPAAKAAQGEAWAVARWAPPKAPPVFTLNIGNLGPVEILRPDGKPLQPGDLREGQMINIQINPGAAVLRETDVKVSIE